MHGTDYKLAQAPDTASRSRSAFSTVRGSSISERGLIIEPVASPAVPDLRAEGFIRLFDVVAASLLIVAIAPVLLLIALAVVLIDGTPVIFAHRRVGKGGVPFNCYKFRTMYVDAERRLEKILAESPALRREWQRDFKLEQDPRVTPIGNFLRVTSLDELPQLFNVLAGDMSLVGPRPIIEAEGARYGRYICHYLSVKPGLTGVWQVSGRSNTTYRRRVAADVLYVRKRSLGTNLRILLATIPAVLTCQGSR